MIERLSAIYTITNVVNGKVYVGCAKDFHERELSHKNKLRYNKHANRHLQSAWNKYGSWNFKFEIYELCDPSKLIDREELVISHLNTTDPSRGYNICKKGTSHLGVKRTDECKKKIGDANRGKIRSPEFCAALSARQIGIRRGPRSPEVVEKYASKQRGVRRKPHTEETKQKLRKLNLGRKFPNRPPHTDERKQKISAALRGRKRPKFSDEHRRKISIAAKRQWSDGRGAVGEKSPAAKLTNEQIYEIRRLADAGTNRKDIAAMFCVNRQAIDKIANRQRWKHLPEIQVAA